MKKIIIPILGLVLLIGGFLIGRATSPVPVADSPADTTDTPNTTAAEPEYSEPIETEPSIYEEEQPVPEIKYVYLTRFYATVLETENRLLVQGRESNSVQYRENYRMNIHCSDETEVTLDGKPASIEDIAVGDLISVSFCGDITETDPMGIEGVLFIDIFRD